MAIYINGIGLISPQATRDNTSFLDEVIPLEGDYYAMCEPPYKEYIAPKELRRMSKVIRNGIVSAKIALIQSGLKKPDAIITGTGLGCATDTEKFIMAMAENKETLLTPTAFINSTHNTLGGSIAIGLDCHSYNMTYVNKGFSFESALLDAQLMMEAKEINNALVGGFDEMTDMYSQLLKTTEEFHPEEGAIPGQASGFFVLENHTSATTYAQLKEVITIYKPEVSDIEAEIKSLIEENKINTHKTVVLMGYNGLDTHSQSYKNLNEKCLKGASIGQFKHLCGEFYTATAFAFWAAANILMNQKMPQDLYHNGPIIDEIDHVLIYNQFQKSEHSLILLAKC